MQEIFYKTVRHFFPQYRCMDKIDPWPPESAINNLPVIVSDLDAVPFIHNQIGRPPADDPSVQDR